MRLVIFSCLVLTLAKSVSGQDTTSITGQDSTFVTGLVEPCEDEKNKYLAPGAILVSQERKAALPKSAYLNQYVPFIGNQGLQSSCTAFSVSAAISILQNQKDKRFYINKNQDPTYWYSPAFVFNIGKAKYPIFREEDCKDGISYIDAFSVVKQYGIATHKYCEYNPGSSAGCQSKHYPSALALKMGLKRTIGTFQRVERNLDQFKALLSSTPGYPICISVYIDKGYEAAINGYNNYIWSKKERDIVGQKNSRHAMLIVGYADSINCFKVLDSKGDLKGDGGYIWLHYDLLLGKPEVIYDSYVCSLDDELLREQRNTGEASTELQVGIPSQNWIKNGYYRIYNGIRIGCVGIDKKNQRVNYRISNQYTGEVLLQEFTIPVNEKMAFRINGKAFTIMQNEISHKHGWPLTPASNFEITFGGEVTVEQYEDVVSLKSKLLDLVSIFMVPFRNRLRSKNEYTYLGPTGSLDLGSILVDGTTRTGPSENFLNQVTTENFIRQDSINNYTATSFSMYQIVSSLEIQMNDWLRLFIDKNLKTTRVDVDLQVRKLNLSNYIDLIRKNSDEGLNEQDQAYKKYIKSIRNPKEQKVLTSTIAFNRIRTKSQITLYLTESQRNSLQNGIQLLSPNGKHIFKIKLQPDGSVETVLEGKVNVAGVLTKLGRQVWF